ncbi:hypothetical protein PIB30_043527 [Stylosanthes scabra]|uniref:Ferritin/DPS domain-containing protein n=1 Tax=Stylosanthes scabra TaxID=79078 RepID=A0ABU6UG33_9FABA|nr:hypothetical protein [Stylosanthes scabra]
MRETRPKRQQALGTLSGDSSGGYGSGDDEGAIPPFFLHSGAMAMEQRRRTMATSEDSAAVADLDGGDGLLRNGGDVMATDCAASSFLPLSTSCSLSLFVEVYVCISTAIIRFFKESSDEEREHAEKLMKYQNKRGGRVKLQPIVMRLSEIDREEKGDALYGLCLLPLFP